MNGSVNYTVVMDIIPARVCVLRLRNYFMLKCILPFYVNPISQFRAQNPSS